MKKILFYSDCVAFGGCENILVNLMNSPIINEEYEIHFAYASRTDYEDGIKRKLARIQNKYPMVILSNNNLFEKINMSKINRHIAIMLKLPFLFLQATGFYALYNVVRLYLQFKEIGPDLLHINNGGYPAARSSILAVFSARMVGIRKIVFTVNNWADKQKNFIDAAIDSFVGKNVSNFVVASQLSRIKLAENRKMPFERIAQVFNAIEEETVQQGREELLNEFGIDSSWFVVTAVGLLKERKGFHILLKALDCIRDLDPELFARTCVFIVGEGEERKRLEELIRRLGLEKNALITGYRKNFFDFINAADLFILPSIGNEDMPLVILSAMSAAKPIISTKVGGIIEQIRSGKDGILVEPGDVIGTAEAIRRLASSSDSSRLMGESARKRYGELFTIDYVIAEYMNIYRNLLSEAE